MTETITQDGAPAVVAEDAPHALKAAAEREAVIKTLLDSVGEAYKAARKETQRQLDEAQKTMGVERISATLPDGTEIAKISLTRGTTAAKITDEQAFLDWANSVVPSEIHRKIVSEVRPAFLKAMLDAMTAASTAQWVDADGEIHDVPGVSIVPARARTHQVVMSENGAAEIMRAWRERKIPARILPELNLGEEGAA